jgi:RNA-directed DNA polymerase
MLNSVLFSSTFPPSSPRTFCQYTREQQTVKNSDQPLIIEGIPYFSFYKIRERVRASQMDLVKLAEKLGSINHSKVLKRQRQLILSLDFRLLAVYNTMSSPIPTTGSQISLKIGGSKGEMVERLRYLIINSLSYKVTPVKTVWNPKLNKKWIVILAIEDYCLQAVFNLVLEPLVEMTSDRHSYGFRKFRSAKMALGAARLNLKSDPQFDNKYVFVADIKGFFDDISHQ